MRISANIFYNPSSNMTRENWQLNIPAYTSGTLDANLYSCGYGLVESEENKSVMHLITDTTVAEFKEYISLLAKCGYHKSFENSIDGNCYVAFSGPSGQSYYAYYMQKTDADTGTVRVILDRSSTVSLEEFNYSMSGSGESEFYMFNMNTSNEDTLLIRTADNSWIVIDGGVVNYNGQDVDGEFADSMYEFMREKSGLQDGEKLIISAWYMSHAHRDHFLAFGSLIEKHHDGIELKRIIANVPDSAVVYNSNASYYKTCIATINEHFPNVDYLKVHTGMELKLADVEFTVLFTQDDMVDFWVNNKEDYNNYWVNWKTYDTTDPKYLTYRNGCKLYDYNNSSILSVINVNGLSVLALGDGYRAETLMVPYYSMNTLTTDILKVAHHFNNNELVGFYKDLTNQGKACYVLVTNANFTGNSSVDTTEKKNWYNNLADGQYFIVADYETIYGFKKQNGAIVKAEYDATYSYGATQ